MRQELDPSASEPKPSLCSPASVSVPLLGPELDSAGHRRTRNLLCCPQDTYNHPVGVGNTIRWCTLCINNILNSMEFIIATNLVGNCRFGTKHKK